MRVDTKLIREEWGTVKHFCKKKNVNYNTFKVWNSGYGTSKRLEKIFKKYLIKAK